MNSTDFYESYYLNLDKDEQYGEKSEDGVAMNIIKYVIWGTGEKGKRIGSHIRDDVIAFVETDMAKIGTTFLGTRVISFDEYRKNYSEYPIIVSFRGENEAVQALKKNKINRFFLASDLPCYYHRSIIDQSIMERIARFIDGKRNYCIMGTNVFALQVAKCIQSITGTMPVLLQDCENVQREWLEGYGFSITRGVTKGQHVLGCCYLTEEQRGDFNVQYDFSYLYEWDEYDKLFRNKEIEKFKGLYKGRRCFIVGTGKTLQIDDLDKLAAGSEICISMNHIVRAYEYTRWRPDYYIADDFRVFDEEPDLFNRNKGTVMFLGDTHEELLKMRLLQNVYLHHFVYEYAENRYPDFSTDFSKKCYLGSTVTYSCLQLAYYMGIKEVYLLGIDYTYSSSSKDYAYGHFYKDKNDQDKGGVVLFNRQVELAYLSAKKFGDAHGMRIFNATRGGKLEIFPRVNIDEIL